MVNNFPMKGKWKFPLKCLVILIEFLIKDIYANNKKHLFSDLEVFLIGTNHEIYFSFPMIILKV